MKIIHCSDIHLDSRMESNLPAAKARERNAEICASFGRMAEYAQQNEVAVVMIAGDLFDSERVSRQTVGFVLECIRDAGNVDFLYLRGNHDERKHILSDMQIPDNLKTFGPEWQYYRYGDVVIAGLEMNRENCGSMYASLQLSPADTNIVMLHGQESARSGEELIALPRLKNRHIHYLALGHIHSYKCERLDWDGVYSYCGCLEGRGFDECGEKGFVLLEVQQQRLNAQFVPFARRTLHEIQVDITDLTTVNQILRAMQQSAGGISPDSLIKVTLHGSYTLETQKDMQFLKKMLEEQFYFVKIKDESRLKIDKETYEHDISLKGEFIRLVMASDASREDKEQMILCGIQSLSGEGVTL